MGKRAGEISKRTTDGTLHEEVRTLSRLTKRFDSFSKFYR